MNKLKNKNGAYKMPAYKNDVHKRRVLSQHSSLETGVYLDVEFLVMLVPEKPDQDYYNNVVSEYKEYVGLNDFDELLAKLGLELEEGDEYE